MIPMKIYFTNCSKFGKICRFLNIIYFHILHFLILNDMLSYIIFNCSKYGHNNDRVFKEEENIEVLKVIG